MKSLRSYCFCLLVLVVFIPSTGAWAAAPARYALAYAWDSDRHRLLEYRQRLAGLLKLAIDRQLMIVGRDQEYGIVWDLRATSAQARKVAEQHNVHLRRAGLKSVQVIRSGSAFNLYNIRFAQAATPGVLQEEYVRLKARVGDQAATKLVIEKIDGRTYAIVYRCWQSKAAALRLASQYGTGTASKKGPPALIPAVDRPVVSAVTAGIVADKGKETPRTTEAGKNRPAKEGQERGPGVTTGLNGKMDVFLREEIRKGKIQPQVRTGWAAYDLTSNTYLVSFNLNRSFQAASMIKPFVALAFFHQVSKGKATYTNQDRQMMEAMIQHSSNPATNWFIRKLGGPARCEALLKKEYGSLVGQIRIKEYIPPDGRTYKNSIQPSGYIQFLRALWNYQLPDSKEMLRLMSLPGPDRLVYGSEVPGSTRVYNKTGTTAHLCGDMGILVAQSRDGRKVPYAIVGIVERPSKAENYKQWMRASGDAIRDFSSLVYEEVKRKHNLL